MTDPFKDPDKARLAELLRDHPTESVPEPEAPVWLPKDVDADKPTSNYPMPTLPFGHDWLVRLEGHEVVVTLRQGAKSLVSGRFFASFDNYVNAAACQHAAETLLAGYGPVQIDLSSLDNFTAGLGVVKK